MIAICANSLPALLKPFTELSWQEEAGPEERLERKTRLLDAFFETAKACGYEAVELMDFTIPLTAENAQLLKNASEKHGLPFVSCRMSANGELTAEETIETYRQQIDLAHLAGSPIARFMPLCSKDLEGQTSDEAFEALLPKMCLIARELCDYAGSLGMKVAVENSGPFFNGAKRLGRLVEAVARENYGLTVDIANFRCVGEDPLAGTKALLPYALNLHIKDFYIRRDRHLFESSPLSWIPTPDGAFLRGAIFGYGDIDLAPIMKAIHSYLETTGKTLDLSVEFEGVEDEVLAAKIALYNYHKIGETL